jgi:hypothetical protein
MLRNQSDHGAGAFCGFDETTKREWGEEGGLPGWRRGGFTPAGLMLPLRGAGHSKVRSPKANGWAALTIDDSQSVVARGKNDKLELCD